MPKNQNQEIIEFVTKTTEAITVISQSTKAMEAHSANTNLSLKEIDGKLDGLKTLFVYTIMPLVGGILALVGIKTVFKIP